MNDHVHGRRVRTLHAYRLGQNPALTLDVMIDLGMSESMIARYLDMDDADFKALLKSYNIVCQPRPQRRSEKPASLGAKWRALLLQ